MRQTVHVSTAGLTAFPADGFAATWVTGEDAREERLTLQWENEAWTASVALERERVECVIRLSPLWQVRQALLFRDLDEPDLWLGTDGHGRWGEMNGAHRLELTGAVDVSVTSEGIACSAFVHAIPIRRLPVDIGGSFDARVVEVDVETLSVDQALRTYRRLDVDRWEVTRDGEVTELHVDGYGLPIAVGSRFVRVG